MHAAHVAHCASPLHSAARVAHRSSTSKFVTQPPHGVCAIEVDPPQTFIADVQALLHVWHAQLSPLSANAK